MELPVLTQISYSIDLGVPPVSPSCFRTVRLRVCLLRRRLWPGGTRRLAAPGRNVGEVCANGGATSAETEMGSVERLCASTRSARHWLPPVRCRSWGRQTELY